MRPCPSTPTCPASWRPCAHRRLVLAAEPGAGKTTRVPRALLDGGLLGEGACWVLEPRRLAARLAAARVAAERGEPLGQTVGYAVRFEQKVSPATRICFVTEGLLLRRLQADPAAARASPRCCWTSSTSATCRRTWPSPCWPACSAAPGRT